MALKDLTDEQIRFAYAYAQHLDPIQAAVAIGYDEVDAGVISDEWMADPDVLDAIMIRLSAAKKGPNLHKFTPEDLGITVNALLVKLKDIVNYIPPKPFSTFDKDGNPKLVEMVPYYKGSDKLKAIEMLGKHIGMWTDRQGLMTDPNSKESSNFARVFNTDERKQVLDTMWAKAKKRMEQINNKQNGE